MKIESESTNMNKRLFMPIAQCCMEEIRSSGIADRFDDDNQELFCKFLCSYLTAFQGDSIIIFDGNQLAECVINALYYSHMISHAGITANLDLPFFKITFRDN